MTIKKWDVAMDDSAPENHHDPSLPVWNCRCVMIPLAVPWIVEVVWIADLIFGDTDPRLPEFTREPKGILHA